MEIGKLAAFVFVGDLCQFQVLAKEFDSGHHAVKDSLPCLRLFRPDGSEFSRQFVAKEELANFAILGRGGSCFDVRHILIKIDIAPLELAKLVTTETGICGRQVNDATIPGDGNQGGQFFLCQGATLFLIHVLGGQSLDRQQWVK